MAPQEKESATPGIGGEGGKQSGTTSKRKIPRWVIWVLGSGVLVCGALVVFVVLLARGTSPGIVSYSPNPTPQPGAIQVDETFDNAYKWSTKKTQDYTAEENHGRLSIESFSEGFNTVAFQSLVDPSDYSIDMGGGQSEWLRGGDVDMTFDASVARDSGVAIFGAACRAGEYNGSFYGFFVESGGHFKISKFSSGKGSRLAEGNSRAVHTGLATNQIHIVCSGERLTLAVNGTDLATVMESSLKTGVIGLIAGAVSANSPDTIVTFDNLVIKAP